MNRDRIGSTGFTLSGLARRALPAKAIMVLAIAGLAGCASSSDSKVKSQGAVSATVPQQTAVAPRPVVDEGPEPGTADHFQVNVRDRVFFQTNADTLDEAARAVVRQQVAWLQTYPGKSVVIEGHCDERGTREYNLALGGQRAQSIKDYMISLGLDPNRIRIVSYGKERPVVAGSNDAAWRLNRRGVTRIVDSFGS